MGKKEEKNENKITQTKQHLMEIGLTLISQNTYSNVGVQEICSQAGITKGGFYHHFKSKADLFKQSTDFIWSQKKEALDHIISQDHNPRAQVEALISFLMSAYTEAMEGGCKIGFCPIFCAGAQGGTEDKIVQESIITMSNRIQHYTIQLTKNLMGSRDIPESTNAEQTGRLLHYFLQGIITHSKSHPPDPHEESDLRAGVYKILNIKPTESH